MVQFNTANGTNNTNYAAPYVRSLQFCDGTYGSLPNTSIMSSIVNNKTAIQSCYTACNKSFNSNNKELWSCRLGNVSGAYRQVTVINMSGS